MTENEIRVRDVKITVNGSPLSPEIYDGMLDIIIEDTVLYPSMFTMRFFDGDLSLVDGSTFALGAAVDIQFQNDAMTFVTILKGEITAIEPEYERNHEAVLVVRGFDKRHRLNRASQTKSWLNVKHSDIVSQLVQSIGLSAQMDVTSEVYPYVYQSGVTDLEFLYDLARQNGRNIYVEGDKLYFKKPAEIGTVTVEWGTNLFEFRPRLSIAKQVNEVTVKGWDPAQKQVIVGTATSSTTHPSIGLGKSGGQAATSAISAAKRLEVRRNVSSQADAQALAAAILDAINMSFVEAEGVVAGNPALVAGKTIQVQKVGTKFSGKYYLTSVQHVYERGTYETHFTVEGSRPHGISDLVSDNPISLTSTNQWHGVYTALVTNNNISDSEGKGQVKLKFPWMDDTSESFWARVAMPGAGATRGMMWLPEVNDEVLVAFEQGDFTRPYVLGGLWNGRDAVPETAAVANGKVEKRVFKTRTGHKIELDDTSGSAKITIIDAQSKTSLVLDQQNQKIVLTSTGDVEISASAKVLITGTQGIDIKASGGDLTLEGNNVTVNAKTGNASVKGATGAELSATGGNTTVKGMIVNIN